MEEKETMRTVEVGDVYQKIKEISNRNMDSNKPISIDAISSELDANKKIIQEYVNALTILELIRQCGPDGTVSIT